MTLWDSLLQLPSVSLAIINLGAGETTTVLIEGPGRLTVNQTLFTTSFITMPHKPLSNNPCPHHDTLGLQDQCQLRLCVQ